ncbi:hypothetical protein ACIBI3_02565 [Actinomadura luteofluorescens]|uniref:hypothetical protein n=1 Tax=Actinomadura luteofluorescens TaxID=46163 RepID=UPI003488D0D4
MVAARRGQFAREDVGAHDREARPHPAAGGAVAGVVLGVLTAAVRLQFLVGEHAHDVRAGPAAGRGHRHAAPHLAVELAGADAEPVRRLEDRDVVARVPDEPRLVAEREPPDVRVQPVGTDDQVERARGPALEGDVHAVRRLGHGRDRVAEDVPGGVPGQLVQELGEIAPVDLHVPAGERVGQADPRPSLGVDEVERAGVGPPPPDLVQDAHLLQHPHVHLAAEVDGLAARPDRLRALHDGDVGGREVCGAASGDRSPRSGPSCEQRVRAGFGYGDR